MSQPTPESIAERKTRDRLAFLALPPEEAQAMIRLGASGPVTDVSPLDQDLSYGLGENWFLLKWWTISDRRPLRAASRFPPRLQNIRHNCNQNDL